MKIDETDFEWTAKAVYVLNPSAKLRYSSWKELQSFMVSMAYRYCHETNCFSTGGFRLTAFNGVGNERHVTASVSAYLAKTWLSEMDYINPDSVSAG
ncbi:MAG: hypothetical protein ACO20M_06370 [Methylophilaceae bacterium]